MALKVTIQVFSGRKNPTWTLTGKKEKDYYALVGKLETPSDASSPGASGGLGYRGISVEGSGPDKSAFLHFASGGLVDAFGMPSLVDRKSSIETFLLRTTAPARIIGSLSSDVLAHIEKKIPDAGRTLAPVRCPRCFGGKAPDYNPGMWNTPAVQPRNNCYNYANNLITNTFAQPGRGSGRIYRSIDCAEVGAAAQRDGLVPAANFTTPAPRGYYVALVIWPGTDFHWYRQDKGGCWSHKPGQTAARNTDNAGRRISDPRTANRGPYTRFCCFMVTTPGRVRIR